LNPVAGTNQHNHLGGVVRNEQDVPKVHEMLDSAQPEGTKPFTLSVLNACEQISSIQTSLTAKGQKAVVILATDRLPSDEYGVATEDAKEEFAKAMAKLQLLPVSTTIRLCTSDPLVLSFYVNLAGLLEHHLGIVCDCVTQAQEVATVNPWLNYSMSLHHVRELGLAHYSNILDLLYQRPLTKAEVGEFVGLWESNAPDVKDWHAFVTFLEQTKKEWCPSKGKMDCWINVRKLNSLYGQRFRNTVLAVMKRRSKLPDFMGE
jgi:hypothetical protein